MCITRSAALALAVACGSSTPAGPQADATPAPDAVDAMPAVDATPIEGLTQPGDHPLLTDTRVAEIDLTLDASAFAQLEANPFEYVTADIRIDQGPTLTVGVRTKGNHSWCGWPCADRKPALRIDVNRFVAGQTLDGLTHLTLNNMADDPTKLRELLFYALARASYVPAPRVGYAWLRVNGEDVGLVLNVETEDKPMMAAWFSSDDGDLYEGEMADLPDLHDAKEAGIVGDHQRLDALLAALQVAQTAPYRASVEDDLDVDQFFRFAALERIGCATDAYTQYFADGGAPNNYRIYAPPGEPFRFIPWGADRTWGGFTRCSDDAAWYDVSVTFNPAAIGPCGSQLECKTGFEAAARHVIGQIHAIDLLGQFDRVSAMLAPYHVSDGRAFHSASQISEAQALLRETVMARGALIVP